VTPRPESRRVGIFVVLVFCFGLGLGAQADAATYYVANAGDDACDGTSQTIGSSGACAWKTIAHVNAQTFVGDDQILFNKGDTWREQLTVPSSGTSGHPITFGAYGNNGNPRPVINGSDVVTGWSLDSAPILQQINGNGSTTDFVNLFATGVTKGAFYFIAGSSYSLKQLSVQMKLNNGTPYHNPITVTINSDDGTTHAPSTTLGTSDAYQPTVAGSDTFYTWNFTTGIALSNGVGYWMVLNGTADNSNRALISTGTNGGVNSPYGVYTYNGSWIAWPGQSTRTAYMQLYSPVPANIYQASVSAQPKAVWIDGVSLGPPVSSLSNLTTQNQWYWSGGVLYIYSTTDPSVGHSIEAAQRSYSVYINQVNYVILDGFELKNANDRTVYLRNCTNATLQNLKIHDAVNQGIIAGIGGGNHTIQNSEIYNSALNGAFGTGSAIQIQTTTLPSLIQNNYIHDIGISSVAGNHAIYSESGGNTIRFNRFKNIISSTGIKVSEAGTLIYDNLFDSIPNGGLYIDPFSNIKVYNNTFYNTGTASPYASVLFIGDGIATGVEVKNNIVYVPDTVPYSVGIIVQTNATGFTSDNNDVYGAWYGEWLGTAYNSLASWNSATGQDAHSSNADPKFTITGSDFTLQPTSPAINAGTNVGLTTDYAGNPVPSGPLPDMGAYEFQDTTAPTTTASPVQGTYTTTQSVTLTCNDGSGVGCDKTYYTTDGTDPTTSSTQYSGAISIPSTTTLKFFSTDLNANPETFQTKTYTIDALAPTGESFTINSGATATNVTSVTLNITCPTDTWTPVQMAYGNTATPTNWTNCVTSQSHTLVSGDGVKTVYIRFKDGGGNTTSDLTQNITLDTTSPTSTLSAPTDGSTVYGTTTSSSITVTVSNVAASSNNKSDKGSSKKKDTTPKRKIGYHIKHKAGETTAPFVTIDAPRVGTTATNKNRSLFILAHARDASGMKSMIFSVDGKYRTKKVAGSKLSYTYTRPSGFDRYPRVVYVIAYDNLGNQKKVGITLQNGKVVAVRGV